MTPHTENWLYPQALRARRPGWWKPLVGLLLAAVAFLLSQVVTGIGQAVQKLTEPSAGGVTPIFLAILSIGLALLIPASLLWERIAYGKSSVRLHSVEGRFRWGWFVRSLVVILPIFVVTALVTVLPASAGQFAVDPQWYWYLLIILVLVPLQAAGEEYLFRGLIARSIGTWFSRPWPAFAISALVSSGLFAVAHSSPDPVRNAFYFGFGLVCSVLAFRTGGLESAVVVHAVNNMLAFSTSIVTGRLSASLDAGVAASWTDLAPVGAAALSALVLDYWFRKTRYGRTLVPATAPERIPSRSFVA